MLVMGDTTPYEFVVLTCCRFARYHFATSNFFICQVRWSGFDPCHCACRVHGIDEVDSEMFVACKAGYGCVLGRRGGLTLIHHL
jgi:hypothetical protein